VVLQEWTQPTGSDVAGVQMTKLPQVLAASTVVLLAVVAITVFAASLRPTTRFADGFREENFERLPYGVSMPEARATLGQPLSMREYASPDMWVYCLFDPIPISFDSGLLTTKAVIAVDGCPTISFDRSQRVSDVVGFSDDVSRKLAGQDAKTVAAVIGEPPVRRRGGTYVTWYYSKPGRKESPYILATITFDPRQRLVDKAASRAGD